MKKAISVLGICDITLVQSNHTVQFGACAIRGDVLYTQS